MRELSLPELQAFSLDILADFSSFCEANGLKWSIAYGTLIGAVRHKGFIPWDDDIDVVMPRRDFEKFSAAYKSEKYSFLAPGPDSYLTFGRVYDSTRTVARDYSPWHSPDIGSTGVWIDVFPIDSVPDDMGSYISLYDSLNYLYRRSVKSRHFRALGNIDPKRPLKNFKRCLTGKLHPRERIEKLDAILNASKMITATLSDDNSKYIAQLGCPDARDASRVLLERDWYSEMIPWTFSGLDIKIPAAYDKILSGEYGDYMQLPPVKMRKALSRRYVRFYWK